MALIVNSKVKTDTHSTSCQSASSDDEFFGGALAEKPRQGNSSKKLLDDFLKEKHESQSKAIATLLSNTTLRELCSVQHSNIFQYSNGTPVFPWERCV